MARLLDRVRDRVRTLHDSIRTEDVDVPSTTHSSLFYGKRHPQKMGAPEREACSTHPAVDRDVAASYQNQALSAILILSLDREVPGRPLEELGRIAPARTAAHGPDPGRGP